MKDDFEEFKETMKDFTKSIFDITNESVGDIKDQLIWWDDNSDFKKGIVNVLNRNNDIWEFPSFYETRHVPGLRRLSEYYSPYGLMSYKSPGIRKYHECLEKQGLSLWDSNGYWRCLFPNAVIPNELLATKDDRILTKEDFETLSKEKGIDGKDGKFDLGEKGIYFKSFEDLMNWKSIMYGNMKLERQKLRDERMKAREAKCHDDQQSRQERRKLWEEKRQAWKESHKDWDDKHGGNWGWLNKLHDDDNNTSNDKENRVDVKVTGNVCDKSTTDHPDNGRQVVSSDIQTSFTYKDDEAVYKETRTEYYNDGTSTTHTITKTKPDNGDWKLEENDSKSKGWFWN